MKSLLAKLTEIEASIRSVRDEIARQYATVSTAEFSAVDFSSLQNVTPESWRRAFGSMSAQEPTEATPYWDIGPDLMVGFDQGAKGGVLFEQQPIILHPREEVRFAYNVWLTRKVDWVTFELRVPPELCTEKPLLFAWTSSAREPQTVRIHLYQRTIVGEESRNFVDDAYIPGDFFSDIKSIKLNSLKDLSECKIFFEFDASRFNAFSLADAGLYLPAAN